MRLLLQLSDGKKGEMLNVAVAVVLAVLFLVVALGFLNQYVSETEDFVENNKCYQQVRQHATQLQLTGQQFASQITACEPKDVTVGDNDNANERIANEMAKCWRNFGKGNLSLFKGEHVFCHICATIDFENKGETISGFSKYLAEEEVPPTDKKYIEYLTLEASEGAISFDNLGEPTEGVDQLEESYRAYQQKRQDYISQETINTDKKYSIVFIYAKGQNSIKRVVEHLTAQTEEGELGKKFAIPGVIVSSGGVMALLALGSNPAGWIAAGGGAVWAIGSEVVTYLKSDEAVHEWVSFTMLTESSPEELKNLNCQTAPVK